MKLTLGAAVLAVCLYLASGAPVDEVPVVPYADEVYRLPTIISPVNYKMTLKPYLLESDPAAKRFTFDGELWLTITTSQATSELKMHTKNLKFTKREYWAVNTPGTVYTLPDVQTNNVTDIITYNLPTALAVNQEYVLHFVYNGTMDDDMHGFYRSSYTDSKNVTK